MPILAHIHSQRVPACYQAPKPADHTKTAEAETATDGIILRLDAVKPVYVLGDRVPIRATVENLRSTEINCLYNPKSNTLVVTDPHHAVLPMNALGQSLNAPLAAYSLQKLYVAPHRQSQKTFYLNIIYDFHEPGVYTITQTRRIPSSEEGKFVSVTSNALQITFVPPAKAEKQGQKKPPSIQQPTGVHRQP